MKILQAVLLLLLIQDKPFPEADPAEAIAAAKKRAAAENRRVLVVWGANDSEASRAIALMLQKNREARKTIRYEFDLVLADAHHSDLAKKLGADPAKLPWATILAADWKPLANVAAPADPKAMVELLLKHKAEPLIARDVLAAAFKRAAGEKKRILLTFGAPW